MTSRPESSVCTAASRRSHQRSCSAGSAGCSGRRPAIATAVARARRLPIEVRRPGRGETRRWMPRSTSPVPTGTSAPISDARWTTPGSGRLATCRSRSAPRTAGPSPTVGAAPTFAAVQRGPRLPPVRGSSIAAASARWMLERLRRGIREKDRHDPRRQVLLHDLTNLPRDRPLGRCLDVAFRSLEASTSRLRTASIPWPR